MSEPTANRKTRHDYRLIDVLDKVTPEVAAEVIAFWGRNGAVPDAEGQRRIAELVCIVRSENGELVGVATAYEQAISGPDVPERAVFLFRNFIRETDRMPLLFESLFFATCHALETGRPTGPREVVAVLENRKYTSPGIKKRFLERKGQYLGTNPQGLEAWSYPLDWDGPHRHVQVVRQQ